LLCVEARLLREEGCVEEEEFVGCAQVACEKVWEYATCAVQGRCVGVIGFVPGVFEGGKRGG
jgi:hypothetical protein